jgi:hypothetical protein
MPHCLARRLGGAGVVLSGPFPVVVVVGQTYCGRTDAAGSVFFRQEDRG